MSTSATAVNTHSNYKTHEIKPTKYNEKIDLFHKLHHSFEEKPFVLQNAWDALSEADGDLRCECNCDNQPRNVSSFWMPRWGKITF